MNIQIKVLPLKKTNVMMEKTYKRICEMFSDEELHDIAADQNSILQ